MAKSPSSKLVFWPFVIVDVDHLPDGSTPRSYGYFHYQCADLGGRNVMHVPFAGGMRIDLQCLPGDDAAYLGSPDGARESISSVVDPWYGERYSDFVRLAVARLAG